MTFMTELAADPVPWAWLIAGLVLVGLETLTPGIFLVWLGVAALMTGGLGYGFELSWQTSLVAFAVFAILSVLAGRSLMRGTQATGEIAARLNRRGDLLVGRVFPLDGAMAAGEGRIRLDDSVWRVTGPDAPAGSRVRIVRIEGATLIAEPAEPGSAEPISPR